MDQQNVQRESRIYRGDSKGDSECAGISTLQVETCNEDIPCASPSSCEYSPWQEWSACHHPSSSFSSFSPLSSSSSFDRQRVIRLRGDWREGSGDYRRPEGGGGGTEILLGQRVRYRGILKHPRDPSTGQSLPCDFLRQPLLQIEECLLTFYSSSSNMENAGLLSQPLTLWSSRAVPTREEEDGCIVTPWSEWSTCDVSCEEEEGKEILERRGWRTRIPPGEKKETSQKDKLEEEEENCGPTVETERCTLIVAEEESKGKTKEEEERRRTNSTGNEEEEKKKRRRIYPTDPCLRFPHKNDLHLSPSSPSSLGFFSSLKDSLFSRGEG
ncbi:thrombospondin type 1 domain-containing protein, partial [Cystoisospora suis]